MQWPFCHGFLPVTLIHDEMMLGYFDRLKIQHMQHCAMVAMTVALLCTLISPMLYFALKYKYIVYPRTLSGFDSGVPSSPNSRRYLSQIGKVKPLLTCSFSQVTQAMPSLSRSLSQPWSTLHICRRWGVHLHRNSGLNNQENNTTFVQLSAHHVMVLSFIHFGSSFVL